MRSFGTVLPAVEKLEGGLPMKRGAGMSGANDSYRTTPLRR